MGQREFWHRAQLDRRRTPDHPVVEAYVVSKIDVLRAYLELDSTTKVLDVGCGNGFFMYYFDRICDVHGVDFSEKMLAINPVKKTSLMDAENLRFDNNSYDVVFCHALLHHVDHIDRVVREMRRVSRKHVVLLEPNRSNPLMFLFAALKKEERKALHFSLDYCTDLAVRNGLRVVDSFSYGLIVPNKTPSLALPLTRRFDFKQPWGMTNFVIAQK